VSVTATDIACSWCDDEPNIVDVVTMALRFQGFSVESAGTGAQALSAVSSFHPHLIVLDVMLPDMEGFDVAQRLGAQHARVPIIYLTARDATEDKIRGLSLGGDDYVTKPFSLEELVARIRSILRGTLGPAGANAVALALTAVANTAANRRLTFGVRGRERLLHHHARGAVVYVLTLGLTTLALASLHRVDPSPSRTVELAVLVVAGAAATITRYLALRTWVFARARAAGTAAVEASV
jgi:DNA-binding response OmpR family regulator